MIFKLLLLAVGFIPALVFAQPNFNAPAIDKSINERPVFNQDRSGAPNNVAQDPQNAMRQDQQEAIDKVRQELLRQEMIEIRPLLQPPSIPK